MKKNKKSTSLENQISFWDLMANNSSESNFTVDNEDLISDFVKNISEKIVGVKERIVNFFTNNIMESQRIDKVKEEYVSQQDSDVSASQGGLFSYDCGEHQVIIDYENQKENYNKELPISWNRVTQKIENLVENDNFLSVQEKAILEILQKATPQVAEPKIISNVEILEMAQKIDFRYKKTYPTYPKLLQEKLQNNIDSINQLKLIESENRMATESEQEILSKYVGWGGLQEAFDENNAAWEFAYDLLKLTLTDEEYTSARASTLTAFYTEPYIIRKIWSAIEKFGFSCGNVLEPAMGIGNFFATMPETLNKSSLYGVEIDNISGRIAKQLQQSAKIQICGFEKTAYQNNSFDIAIGNVPFGDFKVNDAVYNKLSLNIHDYFFIKTLDLVRAGGIIAFITSKGTMDKEDVSIRKMITQKAEFLGAVRLPDNAFKAIGNTKATSDIIFLQKRAVPISDVSDELWINSEKIEVQPNEYVRYNSYFIHNPNMMLGKMKDTGRFGGGFSICKPLENSNLETDLAVAIENITAEFEGSSSVSVESDAEDTIPADLSVKNYSYTFVDDVLYFRKNSVMEKISVSPTVLERIKGLHQIRNAVRTVINIQLEGFDDDQLMPKIDELNRIYDMIVKKNGYILSSANQRAFSEDSDLPLISSLEIADEGKIIKADMFYKRTIRPIITEYKTQTSVEALTISLNIKGCVNVPFIAECCGKTQETVIEELIGIIFLDPLTNEYQTADEYLSGKVVEKLELAKVTSGSNSIFNINVAALEKVQPELLTASEIEIRLGATWYPLSYVNEFIYQLLELKNNKSFVYVNFDKVGGKFYVNGKFSVMYNINNTKVYGSNRITALEIIENILNLRSVKVRDAVPNTNPQKYEINKEETIIARQKESDIKESFKE